MHLIEDVELLPAPVLPAVDGEVVPAYVWWLLKRFRPGYSFTLHDSLIACVLFQDFIIEQRGFLLSAPGDRPGACMWHVPERLMEHEFVRERGPLFTMSTKSFIENRSVPSFLFDHDVRHQVVKLTERLWKAVAARFGVRKVRELTREMSDVLLAGGYWLANDVPVLKGGASGWEMLRSIIPEGENEKDFLGLGRYQAWQYLAYRVYMGDVSPSLYVRKMLIDLWLFEGVVSGGLTFACRMWRVKPESSVRKWFNASEYHELFTGLNGMNIRRVPDGITGFRLFDWEPNYDALFYHRPSVEAFFNRLLKESTRTMTMKPTDWYRGAALNKDFVSWAEEVEVALSERGELPVTFEVLAHVVAGVSAKPHPVVGPVKFVGPQYKGLRFDARCDACVEFELERARTRSPEYLDSVKKFKQYDVYGEECKSLLKEFTSGEF